MFDPNSQHELHNSAHHQQIHSVEKKPVEKNDFPFNYNVNAMEKTLPAGQTPFCYSYALMNQMQLATTSTDSMFACDICGLVFGSISLLNHHKRVHGLGSFNCDLCPIGFTHDIDLKTHKDKVHCVPPKKNSITCGVQTDEDMMVDSCSKCDYGGKNDMGGVKPKELAKSKNQKGRILYPKGYYPVKKKKAATILKCHKCDGSGIVVIETTHSLPEKKFQCNICGSMFATYSSMWSHRRLHSGEKPYRCKVCGVSFARAAYLKNHSRVHTGERPFKCDVCGMQFSQSAHLKNHSRIHSGERPYECDVCQKTFARHSTLWNHRRIHTGEKPYECGICGSAFNQATHLRNHVKIHTGEKHFICDICDVSFSDRYTLKRHRSIHEKLNEAVPNNLLNMPFVKHYQPLNPMDNVDYKCNLPNIAFPGCSRANDN